MELRIEVERSRSILSAAGRVFVQQVGAVKTTQWRNWRISIFLNHAVVYRRFFFEVHGKGHTQDAG
jgi:hypothetical protein